MFCTLICIAVKPMGHVHKCVRGSGLVWVNGPWITACGSLLVTQPITCSDLMNRLINIVLIVP